MTEYILLRIFSGGLITIGALIIWEAYQFIKSKRSPLNRFKPGTKVWFIDLKDSTPKMDYYTIKCLPISKSFIVKEGVQYFSIKDCNYIPSEKELFLNAKGAVEYLNKLKSESNA